jgi:hypothetical protein
MPNIEDLGLAPEPVGSIDYDAPESGSFPPQLEPFHVYPFVFHLEDDPWDTQEVDGRKYLQVGFKASTTVQDQEGSHEVELRFQRASFYKSPKMTNSFAGELIRSLDLRVTGNLTAQGISNLFQEADGRRSFLGEVSRTAYCKGCEIEISTHARKKRIKAGEAAPWPKNDDGGYPLDAACPKCHTRYMGRDAIANYKLPQANGNGSY